MFKLRIFEKLYYVCAKKHEIMIDILDVGLEEMFL